MSYQQSQKEEAQQKYNEALKIFNQKKKFFKKPNYDLGASLFKEAGNLFKMAKEYELAGDSFYHSYLLDLKTSYESTALNTLQQAINCYGQLENDNGKVNQMIDAMVDGYVREGRFLQASKAVRQQAEKYESSGNWEKALQLYQKAYDFIVTENNAYSDQRDCMIKIADIQCLHNKNYVEAMKMYEKLGEDCTKNRLLQFHARGHFLIAFMCVLMLDDIVTIKQTLNKYLALDPHLEGSGEGDFMASAIEAYEGKDRESFQGATAALCQRVNVRGNNVIKTMLGEITVKYFLDEQEVSFGGPVDVAQVEIQNEEDIL